MNSGPGAPGRGETLDRLGRVGPVGIAAPAAPGARLPDPTDRIAERREYKTLMTGRSTISRSGG